MIQWCVGGDDAAKEAQDDGIERSVPARLDQIGGWHLCSAEQLLDGSTRDCAVADYTVSAPQRFRHRASGAGLGGDLD